MRTILLLLFMINIVTAGVFWAACPGNVAMHFGAGGQPDNYGPAWFNFAMLAGVNLLLFCIFFFMSWLARVIPGRFLNLPHKDYWLREENRPRYIEMLSHKSYLMGILTMSMMLAAMIFAMQANLSKPVKFSETPFLCMLGVYFICVIIWIVKFYVDFRVPKEM